MASSEETRVCVIGLGYVGLPLAVALARHYDTVGFDIDAKRIKELRSGHDRTREVTPEALQESTLRFTAQPDDIPLVDFFIVTVPTPIDGNNDPDLTIVKAACRTVGDVLARKTLGDTKPIIVFESTVYPGVTEEICAPIIEERSGLSWKTDFFLGYSPERINPGDREHTIDKITKVVSGDTAETLDTVADLYDAITSGGVFRAASIKAAEAAKVIENAQRDINIAFVNEITRIFGKLDLSIWDVLAAARTKWNFLPFSPGLVGGHCIGVDPFYLSYRANQLGIEPDVILSGRKTNDRMAEHIAKRIAEDLARENAETLVLGLAFKEDVPDLRNSKVADLVGKLCERGHRVAVHDPLVDPAEVEGEYGFALDEKAFDKRFDAVILAVPHREYLALGASKLRSLLKEGGRLYDVKNALPGQADWTL